MEAAKSFLRAHLTAEREPLLLPAAPVRVVVEWAAREIIQAGIDAFARAMAFLEELPDITTKS